MPHSAISDARRAGAHSPRPAPNLPRRVARSAWSSATSSAMGRMVPRMAVLLAVAAGAGCDDGLDSTTAPVLSSSPPVQRYASPAGRAGGDGTAGQPWDLRTALSGKAAIRPGDTLWLRGGAYKGCYTSHLTGTAAARIVVLQYPGEHATLDNAGCGDPALTVHGAYTDFRGFEVTNSSPRAGGPQGIDSFGDEIRFINLVVHDAAGSGIGFWKEGSGGEIYGSILYNNGRTFNLDHGIYTQNATGTKRIVDNVVFDSWAFGVHAHGSEKAPLTGYVIEGNALFANGSIGENGAAPNLLVGGGTPAASIVVRGNYLYGPEDGTGNMWLGYEAPNADLVLADNVVVGGDPALRVWYWSSVVATDNVFAGAESVVDIRGATRGMKWGGASFYANPAALAWMLNDTRLTLTKWLAGTGFDAPVRTPITPANEPWVFVRPNIYEPGRGHVIVYGRGGRATVEVDVSAILRRGDVYEVRPVERVLDEPVQKGVYAGGLLSLPMTPVTPPSPMGGAGVTAPSTRPAFGVFLITRRP